MCIIRIENPISKRLRAHPHIAHIIREDRAGDALAEALKGVESFLDSEQLLQVVMFICMQHRIKPPALYSAYFRRTGRILDLPNFEEMMDEYDELLDPERS